jgi:hypothetical protein
MKLRTQGQIHNEEHENLYSSDDIVLYINIGECMGERWEMYKFWLETSEEKSVFFLKGTYSPSRTFGLP